MGKFMRKSKTAGELAVMDMSQSALGVRTRAKTLALQKLQRAGSAPRPALSPSNSSPSTTAINNNSSPTCYLQLRSRKLLKPPIFKRPTESRKSRQSTDHRGRDTSVLNPTPDNSNSRAASRLRVGSVTSGSFDVESASVDDLANSGKEIAENGLVACARPSLSNDLGAEGSIGENVLESDGKERSTRESTPCSLIRDADQVHTPASTTRVSAADAAVRPQNSALRQIPTAREMEEFFACAEGEQRRQFMEKYNFDPVDERPLPGRYEWKKLDP